MLVLTTALLLAATTMGPAAAQPPDQDADEQARVGTTNEGNTPGIQEGLLVYQLKDDRTTDVYTFYASEDAVNPEDGQIFEGQDVWTRWTTA